MIQGQSPNHPGKDAPGSAPFHLSFTMESKAKAQSAHSPTDQLPPPLPVTQSSSSPARKTPVSNSHLKQPASIPSLIETTDSIISDVVDEFDLLTLHRQPTTPTPCIPSMPNFFNATEEIYSDCEFCDFSPSQSQPTTPTRSALCLDVSQFSSDELLSDWVFDDSPSPMANSKTPEELQREKELARYSYVLLESPYSTERQWLLVDMFESGIVTRKFLNSRFNKCIVGKIPKVCTVEDVFLIEKAYPEFTTYVDRFLVYINHKNYEKSTRATFDQFNFYLTQIHLGPVKRPLKSKRSLKEHKATRAKANLRQRSKTSRFVSREVGFQQQSLASDIKDGGYDAMAMILSVFAKLKTHPLFSDSKSFIATVIATADLLLNYKSADFKTVKVAHYITTVCLAYPKLAEGFENWIYVLFFTPQAGLPDVLDSITSGLTEL